MFVAPCFGMINSRTVRSDLASRAGAEEIQASWGREGVVSRMGLRCGINEEMGGADGGMEVIGEETRARREVRCSEKEQRDAQMEVCREIGATSPVTCSAFPSPSQSSQGGRGEKISIHKPQSKPHRVTLKRLRSETPFRQSHDYLHERACPLPHPYPYHPRHEIPCRNETLHSTGGSATELDPAGSYLRLLRCPSGSGRLYRG